MNWVNTNEYDPTDTCPICYEEYSVAQAIYKTSCGHLFHNNCLNAYFEAHHGYGDCPTCRSNVPYANLDVWAFKNKVLHSTAEYPLFNGNQHLLQLYNTQP